MNKEEKLEFLYSIPAKLVMTDHIGCDPDWFIKTYYQYKGYKSKNGNPKYIKIKYINTPRDTVYMLTDESTDSCRYWMSGRGSIICDSRAIKNELLWFNGRKSESLGKITYEEATEGDLIDWMLKIATTYYTRDIEPREQERLKEQEKKEFKNSFANNYFKLKD